MITDKQISEQYLSIHTAPMQAVYMRRRSYSPIWDWATIVDLRSQSGENGSPSSDSLSPWNHISYVNQNDSQSSSRYPSLHTRHVHSSSTPTSINRLWFCLALAPCASVPGTCFIFSSDFSQTHEIGSR